MLKIALWTFGALFLVEAGTHYFDLQNLITHYTWALFFLVALIGIIPESGPHLIFVSLFAQGLIPFSLLFTSAFIQDGHGLLPLLSYSVKDTILIKIFNIIYGLIIGLILYNLGF